MATKKRLSTEYRYKPRLSERVGIVVVLLVFFLILFIWLLSEYNLTARYIIACVGFVAATYYFSMRAKYYVFQEVKVCKTCGKRL